ncbi:uncharacterized protein EI97DRAFT_413969 [Westerdykella ornata]|uniref:Uncharacterized protein n=1 Tax=Westerdykella ornata TaxID=318751 RepID=A0A6A6JRE4_WESOR|nr:uncharacterized protein EI97DRAFT_413969 [Westerdykella ornata]KAF2278967.1 hypothetical protein EI97DRAFT_413969 [Westerdykella ornata]
MEIPRNAKTNDARTAAGHTIIQWDRFYVRNTLMQSHDSNITLLKSFTREVARDHVQRYPDIQWKDIDSRVKSEMMARVNQLLAREDIPQVTETVFLWRMRKAIRDAKEQARTAQNRTLPQNTSAEQSRPRPFDPVRDQ